MSLKCTKVLQENSARTTLANSEISMSFFVVKDYVKWALRNVFHCQLFKETAGLVYKKLIPKVTGEKPATIYAIKFFWSSVTILMD